MNQYQEAEHKPQKSRGWLKVLAIIGAATVMATVTAILVVKYVFFPTAFKPVTLSAKEEKVLTEKIDRLNGYSLSGERTNARPGQGNPKVTPERYSEEGANREIRFSEREFNALIAKNTDLADKLAIDFSGDLASMKLLVPLDPDFPVVGGKTLKVTAGVELAYAAGKPIVKIRGVSVWGVPIPNAWMGNLKNVDLVQEFGTEKGFWKAFAAGVEDIKIEEGHLRIRLKP